MTKPGYLKWRAELKKFHAEKSGQILRETGYDAATVEAVQAAGLRGQVKIMIGGGTVNGDVCRKVGADEWGTDPVKAVRLAKQWAGGSHA